MANLLSKSQFHTFLWGLLLAAVCFVSGLMWTKFAGPPEVFVVNQQNQKETPITNITINYDSLYLNELSKLLDTRTRYRNNEGINIQWQYIALLDSIRSLMEIKKNLKSDSEPQQNNELFYFDTSSSTLKSDGNIFYFIPGDIESVSNVSLDSKVIEKDHGILINIDFIDSKIINDITPVQVELLEQTSEHKFYLHYSEKFTMLHKLNTIRILNDYEPKKYRLSISFIKKEAPYEKHPVIFEKNFDVTLL